MTEGVAWDGGGLRRLGCRLTEKGIRVVVRQAHHERGEGTRDAANGEIGGAVNGRDTGECFGMGGS